MVIFWLLNLLKQKTENIRLRGAGKLKLSTVFAASSEPPEDHFPTAALFFVISIAFSSSHAVFGKTIYMSQQGLSAYQLLAYRALFSTLINFYSLGRDNIKRVLWDEIPQGYAKNLLMRVGQQNMTLFITFYSIRHFSLTTVSLVNGTTAFIALFLGWFVLGERVTCKNFAMLAVGFLGTFLVIFGH